MNLSTPTPDLDAARHAWCCGRKLTETVGNAGPEIQAILAILWIGMVAVLAVWLRDILRRDGLGGRRAAWLAGWQLGAPLLALAAVTYLAMNNFVAVYAYPPSPLADFAPGWAEMALVFWSGLLTSAVATFARASVQARAVLPGERV
jgi:hypothetical protein